MIHSCIIPVLYTKTIQKSFSFTHNQDNGSSMRNAAMTAAGMIGTATREVLLMMLLPISIGTRDDVQLALWLCTWRSLVS